MTATASPAAGLGGVLPASRVLKGDGAREWGGAGAEFVLFPECAEEAAAVVRAAAESGTRLLPAGGGSWLGAGGWTGAAGAIVSMSRMDGIVHYEPADLTLTAGAGSGMAALADRLRPNGQWLPVDGPGSGAGTLGGTVASGASGALQGRYGGVRDNVLGVEMVTGDGRLLRIGGRVVKNVAGYDMVRLLTGSRGSLGLITRVSVRLYPRPAADVTLCFRAGRAEVVKMARAVCAGAFPVAAVELTEETGPALLVRLLGGEEEVEEARGRVVACAASAPDGVLCADRSEAFHRRRTGWEAGSGVVARLQALPDLLGHAISCARSVAVAVDGEVAADALRGLVRVKGSCPPGRAEAVAGGVARARDRMEMKGGSLTLSEAPPDLAVRVGWTGAGGKGGAGGLAGRVKALFDPDSILASRCP